MNTISHLFSKMFLLVVATGVFASSCSKDQKQKVQPDLFFTHLFERTDGGFTGGDGTYSVLLPDGRTVWIFGDTFLGTVQTDGTRKKMEPMYIRNCFVIQDDTALTTLYTGTPTDYHSLMIPPEVTNSSGTITEDSVWYWPGDAFVENGMLKVFVSKFIQAGEGMWGFKWVGTAIVRFSLPELTQIDIIDIPIDKGADIHFGHAVFEEGDYTYIYGLKEDGFAYGARASKGNVEGEWEYSSDGKWTNNITGISPVLDIKASEQFSIIKLNENYYLITQLSGLSNEIWAFKSSTLSNWSKSNGKNIYTIELPFENPDLFTYNSVVHPQYIDQKSAILISYNTNSHKLQDHFSNALIYRPRFIRVPLNFID